MNRREQSLLINVRDVLNANFLAVARFGIFHTMNCCAVPARLLSLISSARAGGVVDGRPVLLVDESDVPKAIAVLKKWESKRR